MRLMETKTTKQVKAERESYISRKAEYSVVKCIIFTILTLGLWQFYWINRTTRHLNAVWGKKQRSTTAWTVLCFFIPFVKAAWYAESMKRMSTLKGDKGKRMEKVLYTLLSVLSVLYVMAYVMCIALAVWAIVMTVMGESLLLWVFLPLPFVFLLAMDLILCVAMQKSINRIAKKAVLVNSDPDAILEIKNLRKTFPIAKSMFGKVTKELVAVDNVSFKLYPGETIGIVGESGCGKTTLGRTILKLHESNGGVMLFDNEFYSTNSRAEMRSYRPDMQIIFQDPYSSLPPRSTVGDILSEPVKVHGIVPKNQVKQYVLDLMEQCGLRDYYYERYPHEFSGGQRQRICIARALAVNPKLVICDEPVSALDVSIQAQIINLLKDLQKSRNLTYLFISHDLSVVKFISDKVGVMYLGAMMEFGSKKDIFDNPLHPYTKALFSAIPNPDPDKKMNRIVLEGDIPSPANPPKGCRFHTRCPYATERCKTEVPQYKEYESGHFAACHRIGELPSED